ncbi:DUF188 domain-containing protein [Salibacterium aidingense]|uniref:DUF188 domain-containing protein n=1 Tax=Salibacterium aidingense TaxID=384933 RepID=UPI003BC58725
MDTLASENHLESYFVFTFAHVTNRTYYSTSIVLDTEAEAVDLYIYNHVKPGDVVVTQDNGLAAMILQKGAAAVSPRGTVFHYRDIDMLLLGRFEGIRAKQGKTKIKGPPAISKEDRCRFVQALERQLQ